MKIKLTKGKFAVIDDNDFELVSQHSWQCSPEGYAVSKLSRKLNNGKQKSISMHSLIMKTPTGMMTDHINRNKLDNRRFNLRICTNSENQNNSKIHAKNTSGVRGVHFSKKSQKWVARISRFGKRLYIGQFVSKNEAVSAIASI